MANEASARLVINKLLSDAGWRLIEDEAGAANVHVEAKGRAGFADYLLFDSRGFPLGVVEAKAPQKHPLIGKEQARNYAKDHHVRFVFLSNGEESYFWDVVEGNPEAIRGWPSPSELEARAQVRTRFPETALVDPVVARRLLCEEPLTTDYIARTQQPDYDRMASWVREDTRASFIAERKLRFLRPYQVEALRAIQSSAAEGKTRFLLEMATGTGKTLTSAALIKLFLRTGAAHRVLFLVDRLELEDQAWKAFVAYLARDYTSVIYKDNREDWRKAHVMVTTVQSLMASDRYREEFRPSDFGLVISDEAHRSISGQARDVFEYFRGYKLGLTATPRDLLRGVWATREVSEFELEKRVLLDTYRVFGCEPSVPTFRYGLLDGVKDGFLVNPTVIDCRTDKTTQLLSDQGLVFTATDDEGNETSDTFGKRDFERNYFSPETNQSFVATFLDHALLDPITQELGKSLVFCVSQSHAAKITNLLNIEAARRWPGRYRSDLARQVTSSVIDHQTMTVHFAENHLGGKTRMAQDYDSSRVRVCATVGMMTTGYDCEDLLNVVLMRPVFSPSEFIQMKGRGTRLHRFSWVDPKTRQKWEYDKTTFHLFDFFANYEFFEAEYDYEAVKPVPLTRVETGVPEGEYQPPTVLGKVIDDAPDGLNQANWISIGAEGMKVDRMFWQHFHDDVHGDADIVRAAEADDWDSVVAYIRERLLGGPVLAVSDPDRSHRNRSLDVIRTLLAGRHRPGLEALFGRLFGRAIQLPTKEELLDRAFDRFVSAHPPKPETLEDLRFFFKSYVGEPRIRALIDEGRLGDLNSTALTMDRLRRVPDWRDVLGAIRAEVDWGKWGA